jgi:hypothetical protein
MIRSSLRCPRSSPPSCTTAPNESAGHAVTLGATLVTNNLREFARIPGLKVENWG